MEELSIEQKVKRYDEAIKRLEDIMTGKCQKTFMFTKGLFDYIFPELKENKESDDEKIINNIKKVIGWYRGMFTEKSLIPEEYQEIDAWLEKQGEHKPTAEEVLIKAGLKPYKDGDQWCVLLGDNIQEGICGFGNTIEDALYAFLKDLIASQGEQKLNGTFVNVDEVREDFVQEVYRVLDADSTNDRANQIIDAFDNLPTVAIEKQGEQETLCDKCKKAQPSHSCQDITELGRCAVEHEQKPIKVPKFKVGDFIQFNGIGHTRYTVKEVCGLSHYINTCNKRMDMSYTDANFELVEQKPAEWSEEDEEVHRKCICAMRASACGFPEEEKFVEQVNNWLKSLKDIVQHQTSWKPSDAHYELEEFAKIVRGNLTGISKNVQKLFEAKYLQLTGNKMYGGFKD